MLLCFFSRSRNRKWKGERTQGPEGIPSKGKIKVKILQKTKVLLKEEKPQHLEDVTNVFGFFFIYLF